jgi:hypothetical protein
VIPKRIQGATRYLGAPRGWNPDTDGDCAHLAILDLPADERGPDVMISAWEPTPAELAALNGGAPVYLQVVGNSPSAGERLGATRQFQRTYGTGTHGRGLSCGASQSPLDRIGNL